FMTRDRDEWVATLGPADTCVGPVASIPEVASNPHLTARNVFVDAHRDGGDPFRQVGWVLAGMDRTQRSVVREPTVTDTDALLRDAGLDAATIARLRTEGVIA